MEEIRERRQQRRESSSSGSGTSDLSYASYVRGGRNPPIRTTEWKLHNLEDIGITYAEHTLSLSEFMSRLKAKRAVEQCGFAAELPVFTRNLIKVKEQIWRFSFDLSDDQMDHFEASEKVKEVENAMENLESKRTDVWTEVSEELQGHSEWKM